MAIYCPYCSSLIEERDFNVSTDLAYCRQCDSKHKFSDLTDPQNEIDFDLLDNPPKGTGFEQTVSGFELVSKIRSKVIFFLIPFTALWSGFSMFGIYILPLLEGNLSAGEALFGLPFLLGTVVLLSIIIFLTFGRWIVSVDHGEGQVFVGVGSWGWTRKFDPLTVRSVKLVTSDTTVNDVPKMAIKIDSDLPVTFGALIKETHKEYFIAVLRQTLLG